MSTRTIVSCLLAAVLGTGEAAADVTTWHWAPSPLADEWGQPLAPALYYEVHVSRDGGPEILETTVSDTLWQQAPEPGVTYTVRVRAVDRYGRPSAMSVPSEAWTAPAVAAVPPPAALGVGPAWPNPFNPSTVIAYAVPARAAGPVSLRILDARGRLVRELAADPAPGDHTATWDGRDGQGRRAAAGVYLVRLACGPAAAVTKVTLLE